jgi:hypothetical protein
MIKDSELKVFFLIDATFSERDFIRFGLDVFIRSNIQVYLWDFSDLRSDTVSTLGFEEDVSHKKVNRYIYKDYKELNKKIKEIEKAFIIDQRSATYEKYTACWFQDNGAIIVKLDQGLLPLSTWSPSIKDNLIILRNNFINNGLNKTILNVVKYFSRYFSGSKKVRCCNIKVCSGSASKCDNGEFEIRSHSFDYDVFFQERNKKKNSKNYIVFLDNGMVDHPDYQKLGISPYCTDEIYFPLLRSFFSKVEEQTGFQIIVAVHPRLTINDDLIFKYGNREFFAGKSAELVRDAKLVLAHASTAINFVVLWNIPLIVITTDQIERAIYSSMEALTQILKTPRININNSYNSVNFFEISQKPISQYNHYVEKVIKVNGSPIQNSAEILIKGLKKYVQ